MHASMTIQYANKLSFYKIGFSGRGSHIRVLDDLGVPGFGVGLRVQGSARSVSAETFSDSGIVLSFSDIGVVLGVPGSRTWFGVGVHRIYRVGAVLIVAQILSGPTGSI